MFDYKTAYAQYLSGDDIVITPTQMTSERQYFKASEVGKTITISVFAKTVTSNRVFLRASIGGTNINSNTVSRGNRGTLTVTVTPTSTSDFFHLTYGDGGDYNTFNKFMVNEGSTALPYEPYGIKIPISSGGENLFDLSKYTGYSTGISDIIIDENSITYTATSSLLAIRYSFPLTENDSYVVSLGKESTSRLELRYFKDDAQVGNAIVVTSGNNARIMGGTQYDSIRIYISNGNSTGVIVASNIMLNRGSTAIPYEPYNRTTTPIYLGDVPTTRRIKKLVLTGEEKWRVWALPSSYSVERYYINVTNILTQIGSICSHFTWDVGDTDSEHFRFGGVNLSEFLIYIKKETAPTVADFKSFLAAQYAAGTPVTVWYVLANETTGIVNEPLRKIGNYADTVSYEQAGVQIPTLHGNTVIDVETELKPSQMYIKYQE